MAAEIATIPAANLEGVNRLAQAQVQKAKASCEGRHFVTYPYAKTKGETINLNSLLLRMEMNDPKVNAGTRFCNGMKDQIYKGLEGFRGKGFEGDVEFDRALDGARKNWANLPTASYCLTTMEYSYDPKGELVLRLQTLKLNEKFQAQASPNVHAEYRIPKDQGFFAKIFKPGSGLDKESRECITKPPVEDIQNCKWTSGQGCTGEVTCDGLSSERGSVAKVQVNVDCSKHANIVTAASTNAGDSCRQARPDVLKSCVTDTGQNFRVTNTGPGGDTGSDANR